MSVHRRPANTNRDASHDDDLERGPPMGTHDTTSTSMSEKPHNGTLSANTTIDSADPVNVESSRTRFINRLKGKGKVIPSTSESLKNIVKHSPLNIMFLFIPIAWAAHFVGKPKFGFGAQFALNFIAIIPLEKTFDWLGEELAIYLGASIGDLLEITLNNAVEAALGIFLLVKGELRLLQTTLVGVILLHLLLIPGTAFLTGGARIAEQHMHDSHSTELNHSLLTIGVMTLVLPAAYFAALDRGAGGGGGEGQGGSGGEGALLSDDTRGDFLKISRAFGIILLLIYISSRIYLHNPPGPSTDPTLDPHNEHSRRALKKAEEEAAEKHPKMNQIVGFTTAVVTVAIMAATAEWLVDSIEEVQATTGIGFEWFGLILLPLLSFAADGILALLFFARKLFLQGPPPPAEFTRGLAIDLSIQFILFWMPFFVLLAWCIGMPLVLLFDLWEVACLVAACFLVNYVTADAKTNWVEGIIMVAFYFMIAVVAWFYPGQIEVREFVARGSVAEAIAGGGGE